MESKSKKAHQEYKTKDGIKVPGVTTVLGILNKPALVPWAWQMGRDGIDLNKARQQAFDIGTLTHAMIEAHLKKETLDTSEFSKANIDTAETAFLAFLEWEKGQNLKTFGNEVQLVHERLGYGGTIDWLAQPESGKYWLIDFKTSKGGACYPEYKYQVAAYRELWEAEYGNIERCLILSLDKETGLPTPYQIINTEKELEIFKHCLSIYKIQKEK